MDPLSIAQRSPLAGLTTGGLSRYLEALKPAVRPFQVVIVTSIPTTHELRHNHSMRAIVTYYKASAPGTISQQALGQDHRPYCTTATGDTP